MILYGNRDTNAAWEILLADSPVQARRGTIQMGAKTFTGDDLACLFVRPRLHSAVASVGVVGGTGLSGLRLTDRQAYFLSGAAYPDCLVFSPDELTQGSEGILAAGFFGNDWKRRDRRICVQKIASLHSPYNMEVFTYDSTARTSLCADCPTARTRTG